MLEYSELGENEKEALDDSTLHKVVDVMLSDVTDMEFYCSDFAGKEQPHVEGLLQLLYNSLGHLELDMARTNTNAQTVSAHERARRVLHRLISCTNRRMHQGYLEMLSIFFTYPTLATSHDFVSYSLPNHFQFFRREVYMQIGLSLEEYSFAAATTCRFDDNSEDDMLPVDADKILPSERSRSPTHINLDYEWRPMAMETWPLYFFTAATDRERKWNKECLHWMEERNEGILEKDSYHPCMFAQPRIDASGGILEHPDCNGAAIVPGCRIYDCDHWLTVRTDAAWRLPEPLGRCQERQILTLRYQHTASTRCLP